jgi:hypothetical protein
MVAHSSPATSSSLPFTETKPVAEMSLVEIAGALENVTGWIEAQRVREREARAAYQVVADEVDANVRQIRSFAERLVEQQRKRMSSFDSMLGKPEPTPALKYESGKASARPARGVQPKNLADAIAMIWTLDKYSDALTTEEILAALPEVGYQSEAAENSLRSSINQSLAKLCKVGRVVRIRADGSHISPRDTKSRARKYLGAIRLPEPV